MRAEENWRPLLDPRLRSDPLDGLKLIPLGGGATLSLGGDMRLRGETYIPRDFGLRGSRGEDYGLGRFMVHADLRMEKHLRAFLQLRHGEAWAARSPLGATQQNRLDVHQAFVETGSLGGSGGMALRIGRQEISFGSGRMVGTRDGPNVRLSFDGVRASWAGEAVRLDGFVTRPVAARAGVLDDRSVRRNSFWGAYLTRTTGAASGMDVYYLGVERPQASFPRGVAAETRHTIGARLFGRSGAWDWDVEAAYQFGRFGGAPIGAFTIANDVGLRMDGLPWSPRLGLRLDLASGGGTAPGRPLDTFAVPFPRLPYLTEGSLVAPANVMDVHPSLALHPTSNLRLTLDYLAIWKHRTGDAFYLPPQRPAQGTAGQGRFIGHFVQMSVRWDVSTRVTVELAAVRALPGDAIRATGGRAGSFGNGGSQPTVLNAAPPFLIE